MIRQNKLVCLTLAILFCPVYLASSLVMKKKVYNIDHWCPCYKNVSLSVKMRPKKLECLSLASFFRPRILLVSKGEAYPSVAAYFCQRRKSKSFIKSTPVLSTDERAVRLRRGRRWSRNPTRCRSTETPAESRRISERRTDSQERGSGSEWGWRTRRPKSTRVLYSGKRLQLRRPSPVGVLKKEKKLKFLENIFL